MAFGIAPPGGHPASPLFREPTQLSTVSQAAPAPAGSVQRVEFVCYARWSIGVTQYAIATRAALRSGAWHEPVLRQSVTLSQGFSDTGIQQGSRLQLVIVDGPGGVYRTLIANSDIDGTIVTVESVTTVYYLVGSAEVSRTQNLTVMGTKLRQGTVELTLVDLEDARLATMYPAALYTTADFPNVDPSAAGKPVCFPVGTALKVPCALLDTNERAIPTSVATAYGAQWIYSVGELRWKSLAIVGVNTGFNAFEVDGDQTAFLNTGDAIWVFDPANSHNVVNSGRYVVASAAYGFLSAGRTAIICTAAPGVSTVTSSINIPPRVAAVYRDGRLVSSTEYAVEVLQNDADDLAAGCGDVSDPANWWANASSVGTGTSSTAGGKITLSGDGTQTNYGYARHGPLDPSTDNAGAMWRRHQFMLARATVTGKVMVHNGAGSGPQPLSSVRLAATSSGAPTYFMLYPVQQLDARRLTFTTFDSGYNGTITVDDIAVLKPSKPLLLLRFASEQRDFSGRNYTIEADVYGYGSRNAVDEIARVLGECGIEANDTGFGIAVAYASVNRMLVDCAHGREGTQRRARAILEDLLFIGRGTLYRDGQGRYQLAQDAPVPMLLDLDEVLGDLVEAQELEKPDRPLAVSIRYRPSSDDPAKLLHTISRAVAGGVLAAESPRDVPFLYDHEAADRLLCYLALREQYNRKLTAKLLLARAEIGTGLTLGSSALYPGDRDWFVWTSASAPAGFTFEAIEYSAAVHVYTAQALPADAVVTYQPDYTKTPPLAPTVLKITDSQTSTGVARITATCVPPAVNWQSLVIQAVHNTTGEIYPTTATYDPITGIATAVITGMRTSQVHKLQAFAINAFSVFGAVVSSFDATAIGGGAADSTFTSHA